MCSSFPTYYIESFKKLFQDRFHEAEMLILVLFHCFSFLSWGFLLCIRLIFAICLYLLFSNSFSYLSFFLLRYNLHTVKWILFKYIYSLVSFGKCKQGCYQDMENFHHPKKFSHAALQLITSPYPTYMHSQCICFLAITDLFSVPIFCLF